MQSIISSFSGGPAAPCECRMKSLPAEREEHTYRELEGRLGHQPLPLVKSWYQDKYMSIILSFYTVPSDDDHSYGGRLCCPTRPYKQQDTSRPGHYTCLMPGTAKVKRSYFLITGNECDPVMQDASSSCELCPIITVTLHRDRGYLCSPTGSCQL